MLLSFALKMTPDVYGILHRASVLIGTRSLFIVFPLRITLETSCRRTIRARRGSLAMYGTQLLVVGVARASM